METLEAKIKQAILHPEAEVRGTAVRHFSCAFSRDPTVMDWVIRAVQQYGREKAPDVLAPAEELVQTAASVQWLTEELSRDWDPGNPIDDNYVFSLGLVLCRAPVELLRPEFGDLRGFPEELCETLDERLEMASWDWELLWEALERVAEFSDEFEGLPLRVERRAARIIEALARHRDQAHVLEPLLHRRYRGYDKRDMQRLEPQLIAVAGRMGMTTAIPILVERLHEDDYLVSEAVVLALQQIGGDQVATALTDQWTGAAPGFRHSAADALENIYTAVSRQRCLEFFASEEDETVREALANALLGHFSEEALRPIRDWLPSRELWEEETDFLRLRLVAVAAALGVTFPGYDEWYQDAVDTNWGEGSEDSPSSLREDFVLEEEGADDWEDDGWEDEAWDEEGWDEDDEFADEDYESWEDLADTLPTAPGTFRRDHERVGRNDPCPCGSGKKYKRCCSRKDQDADTPPAPRFPVGTVAFYGPDDQVTTKITAGVITHPGAEPILQRWVGTGIKDNARVHREMRNFFQKHGVRNVAMTDGNLGCPHEEGEDFPLGEDCPFCPFWKGKQGTAARE